MKKKSKDEKRLEKREKEKRAAIVRRRVEASKKRG